MLDKSRRQTASYLRTCRRPGGSSVLGVALWTLTALLVAGQPKAVFGQTSDCGTGSGGFTILGDYILDADATLILISGTAKVGGDVDIGINDWRRFEMAEAALQLAGLGFTGPQFVEVMAEDRGGCGVSIPNRPLYSLGCFKVGPTPTTVILVDNRDNSAGTGREAVYTNKLILDAGTTLDLNGFNIYYRTVSPSNPYAPGSGVTIRDSVGGGALVRVGTGTAPQITMQPASQTVCSGSSVTLSVTVTGTVTGYQWRKDGVGIPGATTGSLTINPVDITHSGNYDVTITGTCGTAISDSASIIVWPAGNGDVNGDGRRDGRDIEFFKEIILQSPNGPASLGFCSADMNGDGVVNSADVELLVAALLGL